MGVVEVGSGGSGGGEWGVVEVRSGIVEVGSAGSGGGKWG